MKTSSSKKKQANTTTHKVDKNWFQKRNHITGHRVGNGYNNNKY